MLFKLMMILGLTLSVSGLKADQNQGCIETEVRIKEVPFPKGSEMPFPWESIGGEWSAAGSVFRIEALSTQPSGNKIMRVQMFDPNNGKPLARGLAVLRERSRTARGFMSTGKMNDTYVLLRAFKDNSRGLSRDVMVITLRNVATSTTYCDESHYEMVKLN